VLPAVNCAVQSTLLTGEKPSGHGAVANGRYLRDLGETMLRVVVALQAADRDPSVHADPEELDVRRDSGHPAFGHGLHQCVGQSLARAGLQIGLPLLFDRLPAPRLAATPEDLPRSRSAIHGLGGAARDMVSRLGTEWVP
jgi:hypothetical protein